MFERYTEKARRVIFFALYEASQLSSPVIDTEHILLGILCECPEFEGTWLPAGSSTSIRSQIESAATSSQKDRIAKNRKLPLSGPSKRVLTYAVAEADRLSYDFISPSHLLIGLTLEENGLARNLLKERSIDTPSVRALLEAVPQESRRWNDMEKEPPPLPRLRFPRLIHIALTLLFGLLILQVFVKAHSGELTQADAVFYVRTLPFFLITLLPVTWWLRSKAGITHLQYLIYIIGVPVLIALCLIAILTALRA